MELRGLANRSEGLGTALAWALLKQVRGWVQAGLDPVDKSEGAGGPADGGGLGAGLPWHSPTRANHWTTQPNAVWHTAQRGVARSVPVV